MNDPKFKYFQKKIIEILDEQEKLESKEKKAVKKSLLEAEEMAKGGKGLPVGTVREWKGKKYVKIAPNQWKRKYDKEERGIKIAIAALKKKAEACTTSQELLQLVLQNRDRFSDGSGHPLPIVQELSDYVSKRNDTIESVNAERKAKDEKIKKLFDEKAKRYGVDVDVNNGVVSISKDGKKFSHVFRYKEGAKDGNGEDWNDGAFGNLIIYARQEGLKTPKKVNDMETAKPAEKENKDTDEVAKFASEKKESERVASKIMNQIKNIETEEKENKETEKGKREKEVSEIIDKYMKEYAEDWYTKSVAESSIKKYGQKRLEAIARNKIKDDTEYVESLKKKIADIEARDGEKFSDSTISSAIWNHQVNKIARELAIKKLQSMEKNASDDAADIPVDEKDMQEAISVIGDDVARILNGRDVYGNAKQTLTDKIKRRVRNSPGVARAMLMYIRQEQDKSGKKVFTDKHSIWDELPKLNENARNAKDKGETETKTGVSGNLYEGKDGTTIVENKDWGRYQISFPGKPDGSTISMLKRNGFRWSPSTKTWVCFNSANGERSMHEVAEKLGLEKTDGSVRKSYSGLVSRAWANWLDEAVLSQS